MNKLCLLIILCAFNVSWCYSQVDTEFWFAPPEVTSGHGDGPVYLHISTLGQSASVQVIQPARENDVLASVTIAANTTQTINLSNSISLLETNRPANVMQTGLKIVSSAPVTAYYEIGSEWNSDIFAMKGKNALGGHFVIPGQDLYSGGNIYSPTPYSSFDIVATRNNTVITIKPTRVIFGHANEEIITIRLNAGETYSFRKTSLAATDNAIGTVVISNKPIAITVKDDSVFNVSCYDLLGDQLVPVEVTGTEYVVMKGFLSSAEYIFITATENNTEIFIGNNASPVAVLNAGQLHRQPITSPATYVRTDKKVYVCHVTGFGCELGMAILPSIDCKGSQQIGFSRLPTPANRPPEFFGINIMVRKEGIDDFNLNGQSTLIPATAFTAVPGTNDAWYAAQLNLSGIIPENQASLISNNEYSFQLGIIGGDAQTRCRYGYFSSFSTLFIGDDFELCEGDVAELDAGFGKDSYEWNTGAATQKISVSTGGTYAVRTEDEECILFDTVQVYLIEDTMTIQLNAVSVDTLDESKVNMNWTIEPAHLGVTLLHRRNEPGDWEQIHSVLSGTTSFTDSGMSTDDHVFEYYASLNNLCDESEVTSAVHATMLLTGSVDSINDIISLQWTDYIGWKGGVDRYEVWRQLDDAPGYRLLHTANSDQKFFSAPIAADGFSHKFVLRALESSGNGESWSNSITFTLAHDVFVPNVITPNSDTLNHYFHVTKIELYQNSELTIFDRWGKEVFRKRDYKNDWSGSGLSSGVYYYLLDLKRNNRKVKGTISILR